MFGSRDLNAKDFVYQRRPTVCSFVWATWCRMPVWLRFSAYRLLKYFGKRDSSSSRVTRLPFGLYAKHSLDTCVTEAFATQFVSIHTTVPVPTVLDVLVDPNGAPFILTTRVPGRPLPQTSINANQFSDAQLATFVDTVHGWLVQLRQLAPPSSGPAVCGFMGTPFISYRISHHEPIGPFASLKEFHSQYFCTLPPQCADNQLRTLSTRMHERPYRICFTHGDLSPNNILVDENYVPVGLIDWGCAAWLPEYWELTSSLYLRQRYRGWMQVFQSALPGYDEELAVEMELWEYSMPY